MARIDTMKMYVGIANAVPDSFTPRRFIVMRNRTAMIAIVASWPWSGSMAAAAYCAADEIDTATVRT